MKTGRHVGQLSCFEMAARFPVPGGLLPGLVGSRESVTPRVLCSNYALSPAMPKSLVDLADTANRFHVAAVHPIHETIPRAKRFAQATPHPRAERWGEKLRGVQPPTGCYKWRRHLRAAAQFQTDCPSLGEFRSLPSAARDCRFNGNFRCNSARNFSRDPGLRVMSGCERRPRSRHRKCLVLWRGYSDEKACVLQH